MRTTSSRFAPEKPIASSTLPSWRRRVAFSFGNTIEDEYAALSAGLDFTHEELAQIATNGFEVALVDEATRAKWIAEVGRVLDV